MSGFGVSGDRVGLVGSGRSGQVGSWSLGQEPGAWTDYEYWYILHPAMAPPSHHTLGTPVLPLVSVMHVGSAVRMVKCVVGLMKQASFSSN